MTDGMDTDISKARSEVERLFGQCVLRAQGFELLMKAVLAQHRFLEPMAALETATAGRAAPIDRQTLGALVQQMTRTFIVNDEPQKTDNPSDDGPVFEMHIWLKLPPEDWTKANADLKEIVERRNWLVHQFLTDHSVASFEGCEKAKVALVEFLARIDSAMQDLRVWAADLEKMRSAASALLNNPDIQNTLTGRNISWPITAIVHALQEAEATLVIDGWALVDKAGDWITKHYPNEHPTGYGCKSWRQVIHETQLFDLSHFTHEGKRAAWYRSKTPDQISQ